MSFEAKIILLPGGVLLDQLPKLEPDASTDHIVIAYHGLLHPFDPVMLRSTNRDKSVINIEILGSPHAGKTTMADSLRSKLDELHVPNVIHSGISLKHSSIPIEDAEINMVRALQAAAVLRERSAAGKHEVQRLGSGLLQIYDRNIMNSALFARAYDTYFGQSYHHEVDEIVKRHMALMDVIVVFRIRPEVSIDRGSRMTSLFLSTLDEVLQQNPNEIAWLTKDIDKPYVIIQIDASGTNEETADVFIRSLGTVIAGLDAKY